MSLTVIATRNTVKRNQTYELPPAVGYTLGDRSRIAAVSRCLDASIAQSGCGGDPDQTRRPTSGGPAVGWNISSSAHTVHDLRARRHGSTSRRSERAHIAVQRRYERVQYAGEADPDTSERAIALVDTVVAERVWWSR
ncbi:hypothetical protein HSR121_2288 [Halapricum desulfuricans]|uniref:Uncharacterized protein n=1 Tax=Halapricum desulfuricans TaxID=2841257 RepID=A0A897N8A2_9EURY|nr:hypothetical protein HSR121_2288 [Halapricum desulfuricans]